MSFVTLQETITPGVTTGIDTDAKVLHKLHNARGRVYFTADTKFNESSPGAADGGAKGDWNGSTGTDDTLAINAAIVQCNADGGGEVILTGQTGDTFLISRYLTNAGCIWMLDKVSLVGRGPAVSKLFMKASQVDFIRPISGPTAQSWQIRNLQIDGNDANQAQGSNVNEHQAGIFVDAGINTLIENVDIHNLRGDGVHLASSTSSNCLRPTLRSVTVHAVVRVGININEVTQGTATGCRVYGMAAGNCVKCEIDSELGNPATVYAIDGFAFSACEFDGTGGTSSGVVLSGSSTFTRIRDITISSCVIKAVTIGVSMGIIADGCDVADNVIDGCGRGVVMTSYTTGAGYVAHLGISVVNNAIRGATSTNAGEAQIDIANATGVTVSGNEIDGTGILRGIRLQHVDKARVDAGAMVVGGTGGIGVYVLRCTNVNISGGLIMVTGAAARGVHWGLDDSFPSVNLFAGDLGIFGGMDYAIDSSADPTAATSHIVGTGIIQTDAAVALTNSSDGTANFPHHGRHTFGGMKRTFGTVAPTTGAWIKGDIVYNTNPTAGGTVGWICTIAGSPGVWKTWGAISP